MFTEKELMRFSAAHYLHQWLTLDKPLFDAAQDGFSLGLIDRICRKYGLSRNFEGKKKKGIECFEKIKSEVEKVSEKNHNDRKDLAKAVADAFLNLTKGQGGLSALSKILWMRMRDPVVIYDGNARTGLELLGRRRGDSNYSVFCESWDDAFDHQKDGVSEACKWVRTSQYARSLVEKRLASETELRSYCTARWFEERVFDIRLWLKGSKDGQDSIEPATVCRLLGAGEFVD